MSENYDNELKGSLFKNTYKTEDKHPVMTGTIQIKGEVYKLAAWRRQTRDGSQNYYSIVAEPKEAQKPAQEPIRASSGPVTQGPPPGNIFDDMDDDLPF